MRGRGWTHDREGVNAVIGTILLVAILIGLATIASLTVNQISDSGTLSYQSEEVRIAHEDGRYGILYLAGHGIEWTEALMIVEVDGERFEVPLTWYTAWTSDPNVWHVGETLCVIGPTAACPLQRGQDVQITLIVGDQVMATREFGGRSFRILASGGVELLCGGAVTVRVIGSAITDGSGGNDIPVSVELTRNAGASEPVFEELFNGTDVDGGEQFLMSAVAPGAVFGLVGDSSFRRNSFTSNDEFVRTLMDEEAVPDVPAYADQTSVAEFLQPYVFDQRIEIARNEAIVLFELGVDELESEAADFQDLVVLFELPASCED